MCRVLGAHHVFIFLLQPIDFSSVTGIGESNLLLTIKALYDYFQCCIWKVFSFLGRVLQIGDPELSVCVPQCVHLLLRDPDRDWIRLKHNRQNLFSGSLCAKMGIQKFGTSSAAELNVFFSLTDFSWENQIEVIATDDYMLCSFLGLRTWCIGFFLRHLREKNNSAMQVVSKNAEGKKL